MKLRELRYYEILFFLVPQCILFIMPFVTGDLGFWTALGHDILRESQVITHDRYSVLETTPMIYPSWGISVVYALIDKLGGLEALYLFHRLIFLVFQILIFQRVKHLDFTSWRIGFPMLLAMVGATFLVDRPAMIPMVLFVLLSTQMERVFSSLKDYYALALAFLIVTVWANVHGSALFSIIYLAFFGLWQLSRNGFKQAFTPTLVLLIIFFLATITTPFGIEIYPYSIQTAAISKQREITEWSSPTLPTRETLFEVSIFYLLGVYECLRRYRSAGVKGLVHPVVLSFFFGITSLRNIIWFFWTYLVWAKDQAVQAHKTAHVKEFSLAQKGLVVFLATTILLLTPPIEKFTYKAYSAITGEGYRRYNVYTPYEAAEVLAKENSNAAIFNEFELGGYLIYRLGTKNKIFMDGRNIIYSEKDFSVYRQVMLAQGDYHRVLDNYGFGYILLKQRDRGLAQALKNDENWFILFENSDDILFKRQD